MLDLSGAYILDPNAGMAMSQQHQFMAQAIAERYPNVRLAQVPNHFRTAAEEFPFALIDPRTDTVLKELRESEVNINFIFKWLYEHDLTARGVKEVYAKYLADKAKKAADKRSAQQDRQGEALDLVHSIAKSPKHFFKHNGKTIG